jgi:hypothetical protein
MRSLPVGRRGLAVVMVVILLAVGVVMGLGVLQETTLGVHASSNLSDGSRARYLAESAIYHGMEAMHLGGSSAVGADELGPYTVLSGDGEYYVSAEVDGEAWVMSLTGRGVIGSIERTCEARVSVVNNFAEKLKALAPVGYWRLSDSDDEAVDEMGAHEGEYCLHASSGAAGSLIEDTDSAAVFDGEDSHVDLGAWDVSGDALTIVAWVYPTSFNPQDARIVSKATGTGVQDHYWMVGYEDHMGGRRLRFRLRAGGRTSELDGGETQLELDRWTFVAAVYDGSEMLLYQDGVQVGRKTKTGMLDVSSEVDVWIGGNPSGAGDRPWAGRIDEVAILDRALSEKQVKALWSLRRADVNVLEWSE